MSNESVANILRVTHYSLLITYYRMTEYKVVELNIVTDETIQDAMNTWTQQGWTFESLHFAMANSSKRPAMAFIFFVRPLETRKHEKEVLMNT